MSTDSDCIIDLFTAKACDWTPATAKHAARVVYMPASTNPDVVKHCASILSLSEKEKADRFITKRSKSHFIQRRAFRCFCGAQALSLAKPLSEITFNETEKGRPFLADLPDYWFSFSSCKFGFLGSWSKTHEIGIDLEERTRDLEVLEIAEHFFSKAEANIVKQEDGPAQLQTFYQLWSLKEAALKSIGEGLPFGLEIFQFKLSPNLQIVHAPSNLGGPKQFEPHLIEGKNICAALVIREPYSTSQKKSG